MKMKELCCVCAGVVSKLPHEKSMAVQFYNQEVPGRLLRQAYSTDRWGLLRWLFYILAFAFYLFTRSTTVSSGATATLFAYQIVVLMAEAVIFLSGCLVGMWQVSSYADMQRFLH